MRYVVMDTRKDGEGDVYNTECQTREEAIKEAKKQWSYLTATEKKARSIWVLESQNPDEEAEDHFDGDTVWCAEEEEI